jgi:hypothetical protein
MCLQKFYVNPSLSEVPISASRLVDLHWLEMDRPQAKSCRELSLSPPATTGVPEVTVRPSGRSKVSQQTLNLSQNDGIQIAPRLTRRLASEGQLCRHLDDFHRRRPTFSGRKALQIMDR